MQLRPCRVLAINAIVLHAFDAGGAGAGHGFVVDHPVLQPEIWNAEPDHVVDDRRHVLGGAKDIHEVDARPVSLARRGLRRIEVGVAGRAEISWSAGLTGKTR